MNAVFLLITILALCVLCFRMGAAAQREKDRNRKTITLWKDLRP